MILKNNRAPLLCCFKLCVSFHSHQWIQTKVSPEMLNSGQNRWFNVPCDLEIWQMTLKNNRAPLLCYFKLCASFRSHWWIQTGVTVQKHPIWSKSTIFLAVWPWNFMDDLEKQQGTSHKQHQAICIIPSSYMNSNFSYSPETANLGYDLCDLDLWPMTLTFCMIITSVIGTVITPEKCVMIRWWEHSQKGVTDRHIWTDGRTEPFIELLGRS